MPLMTTYALSRKVLATYQTYDPNDCTSTGYDYTLYTDGRVGARGHCRWQGGIDGDCWTTVPGACSVNGPDPEEHLIEFVRAMHDRDDYFDPSDGIGPGGWRMTRRGWRVQ